MADQSITLINLPPGSSAHDVCEVLSLLYGDAPCLSCRMREAVVVNLPDSAEARADVPARPGGTTDGAR